MNWIVAVTVPLQIGTITIPGLRTALGLVPIDLTATMLIAAAIAVSGVGAPQPGDRRGQQPMTLRDVRP